MLPIKKYYNQYNHATNEVFSRKMFENRILTFFTCLSNLYQVIERKGNKKELMQAYVLGFRAILGIGIALNAKDDLNYPGIDNITKSIETLLFDIYEKAISLKYTLKDHMFYSMFSSYIILGDTLGFNFEDVTYVYENENK